MLESDRMYSVREAPWHLGSGTNVLMLDAAPETRMQRMAAAGQEWTVGESDVYRRKSDVQGPESDMFALIPGWKMLTRSDTGGILHVSPDSYTVVQNVVGHELFEALAANADLGDGTGGTIDGGATCYLSARLEEPYTAPGDDSETYPYVVVTWAHDGSGAVKARATNVRVVCWNTLSASEAQAAKTGRAFTFRHTARVMDRVAEAKRALAGVREEHGAFREIVEELASLPAPTWVRRSFLDAFVPEPAADVVSNRVRDNIDQARGKVLSVLNGPTVPDDHRWTGYGLLLAGTEYLDHLRGYRSADTYLGRTLLREESLKAKLVPMIREVCAA
jgi:phage/plasmid-like protein (TIGR03299 family)